ncbi:unnamed protein product [Cuscuta campestris]|uniref:DUF4283 domain-containing protein n=1 Tax=Cuscuta campestris TaxID=132261 RepID=A0A484MB88_9ASTE|nr:unnamed protein product [Cuscuta campestris]
MLPSPSGEVVSDGPISYVAAVKGGSPPKIPSPSLPLKPISKFKGLPSISFSQEEVDVLSSKFQFALVGVFNDGRPSFQTIKATLESIGFEGNFQVGFLDDKCVLINFMKESDYNRLFMRRYWNIRGFVMKIFKWTHDFDPSNLPPIVPTWISLPGLPIHLHQKSALMSIANMIGQPMTIDAATATFSRPSLARVCVELDLSKENPKKIHILDGDRHIFQEVIYEALKAFCTVCKKTGHSNSDCKKAGKRVSSDIPQIPQKSASEQKENQSRGEWQIVKKKGTKQGASTSGFKPEANPSNSAVNMQAPQENTSVQVNPINNHSQGTSSPCEKDNSITPNSSPPTDDMIIVEEEDLQKPDDVDGKKETLQEPDDVDGKVTDKGTSEVQSDETQVLERSNLPDYDHLHAVENISESLSDSEILARKTRETTLVTEPIASRTRSRLPLDFPPHLHG